MFTHNDPFIIKPYIPSLQCCLLLIKIICVYALISYIYVLSLFFYTRQLMTTHNHRTDRVMILATLIGMALFVVFYVIAALNYPGGSYVAPSHEGFSLKNNYLCDLLDDQAINGASNSARIYARISLGLLCLSLILFWNRLPKLFDRKNRSQTIMSVAGMLSMLTTLFLASGVHDIIVRIAGVFGMIALILSFIELYRAQYYRLWILGMICMLLFLANYYIYETGILLDKLPAIQKVTFISFIGWFVLLSIRTFRRSI